ncbi:MAG: YbgC/FadM family acyl-CoA thioesterase, partial [Pseudomonadota bacterium]
MQSLKQKIFIEDTDFQGVVYHANYLKFFERARSNFLSKVGVSQKELRNHDKAFVVKSIKLDYLNSAGLGTEIIVKSYVEKKSNA